MTQFAGSKRAERNRKRAARRSAAFDARMQEIAALAELVESEAHLDALLAQDDATTDEAKAEIKKLVMAIKAQTGPRIQLAHDTEDVRRAVREAKQGTATVINTRAGALILES